MKKALIIQSLFFCLSLTAQTIAIQSPLAESPLENSQVFSIATGGQQPQRVALFLNGRKIAARTQPPFRFTITWNTSLPNHVRVLATYAGGKTREVEQTYQPPVVDLVEETRVFQCFPFPSKTWNQKGTKLISKDRTVLPQKLDLADPIPCEWIVILDISGSMHFFLDEIGGPLQSETKVRAGKGDLISTVLFDGNPRNFAIADLWRTTDFTSLYREQSQSAIWDSLAAATLQFHASPRRVILLISDGADDGSRHNAKTVAALLRQRDVILIWYNPSPLGNRALSRLAKRSGGFVLQGPAAKAMPGYSALLDNQLHLIAPEASYPIQLKWNGGKMRYPTWEN